MDFKVLKWQILRGSLAKRLILRAFVFALAMIVVSFVQIAHNARTIEPLMLNFDECPLDVVGSNIYPNFTGFLKPLSAYAFPLFSYRPMLCKERENLTIYVFKELMEKNWLDVSAKVLCVGDGTASAMLALRELGVSNAYGVQRHPFFSLLQRSLVHELDFIDNSFDFVFSRALDRVSVPALLVLEIERVLRPGGIGAMLVGTSSVYLGSLIRSATPVSSFLRSSNVVHVCGVGSSTLVIFKKRFNNVASFDKYRLPNDCPSNAKNKPVMKEIEPLVDQTSAPFRPEIHYLPKVRNISLINRLIYINLGAGEFMNSSIVRMFKPNYPVHPHNFNVYIVDHNISAISSYVRKPGVTFVYHPGLAGDTIDPSALLDEEVFEFTRWFKETAAGGDFVILMMNAATVTELKVLIELYESGAICHVDELFLRCSGNANCGTATCEDCLQLFKGLRNSGVYAHQWYGN